MTPVTWNMVRDKYPVALLEACYASADLRISPAISCPRTRGAFFILYHSMTSVPQIPAGLHLHKDFILGDRGLGPFLNPYVVIVVINSDFHLFYRQLLTEMFISSSRFQTPHLPKRLYGRSPGPLLSCQRGCHSGKCFFPYQHPMHLL